MADRTSEAALRTEASISAKSVRFCRASLLRAEKKVKRLEAELGEARAAVNWWGIRLSIQRGRQETIELMGGGKVR